MRASGQRIWRVAALAALLALLTVASAGAAASAWKTVTFRGYAISVPRSWPVYDLSRDPSICVRFNRHAVYLGQPSRAESCPAVATGRSEAILLEPVGATAAGVPLSVSGGRATSFVAGNVRVVATWSADRGLIAHALHRRSLPAPVPTRLHPAREARAIQPRARAAAVVYTGSGFDACSAPSPQAMAAWGSSPYRALGIYIGGVNSACAQPNLTSTWVAGESAAGWHMIPTYVGLQAPSNSCGCSAISASQASAEGTAAAQDAVNDAQALALPPGSPIYDDMENYSRTSSNTSAVMAFLASWTSQLHAEGYLSGVYGNSDSVMADLVARYGTSYPEPDDIWTANWNDQATTTDSDVPSTDWANHQRLHQYRGAHNETYGGVTINIDSDYLDGATATGGAGAQAVPPPALSVSPAGTGVTTLNTSWSGSGLVSWQVLAGTTPGVLAPIESVPASGSKASIALRSSAPYFAVQAMGSSGLWLANSSTVVSPAHLLLFGRSVFVGAGNGFAGVPVGCYLTTTCHVATTVTVGRSTLARTGTEAVPAEGTGLVFFKLTASALRQLDRARGARLAARVNVKDVSGRSVSAPMSLIPFTTRGAALSHSATPSSLVRAVGSTDFVYARGAGGVLVGCTVVYACRVSASLTSGRTTIASTKPELISGDELGYLIFSPTSQGRRLLDHASGNQLGASLVLKSGGTVARAHITLVQFS
ncbi:MAG TPA: DUF1906 domain-containing protein [Solirubrobacteraceae bacterium]|nr:DUF1906 domain-containing protein [Solirubrobacteraceae bacterium]